VFLQIDQAQASAAFADQQTLLVDERHAPGDTEVGNQLFDTNPGVGLCNVPKWFCRGVYRDQAEEQ